MPRFRRIYAVSSFILLLIGGSFAVLMSAPPVFEARGRGLIQERVSENKLVTLSGNTRPEAVAENDLGMVNDELAIDHMLLQLKRSPAQEQAVQQFIADLHDPQSANFHKWLSAAEFGARFGVAESDIRAVTGWLESHGFKVNAV